MAVEILFVIYTFLLLVSGIVMWALTEDWFDW